MSALPESRAFFDSDEDLAGRIRRGDDAAFEEMYRRYAKPLAAVGSRILRDPVAGEDVAQTALLKAYRSMRGGTVPLHVKPWLYRIAENVAFSAHRARRDIVVEEIEDTPAPTDESGFDREAWLENSVSGHVKGRSFEYTHMRVTVDGDTAVADSLLAFEGTIGGKDWSTKAWCTDVWSRRSAGWQVIKRHSSPAVGRGGAMKA